MDRSFGWCFVGSGRITRRVLKDMPYMKGSYVATVYSRRFESAQALAEEAGAQAFETFEEAVSHPEVKAVYVATPNQMHAPGTLAALKLGKPVLCEKPFAINRAEAAQVIDYAKAHNLFVMEGMWTRFRPVTEKVLAWIAEGRIGTVLGMDANFAFAGDQANMAQRMYDLELGGGALLDLGVYPLSLAQFVFGGKPSKIAAMAQFFEGGADAQTSITLQYANGAIARLFCAATVAGGRDAVIYGDKGVIRIENFVFSETAVLEGRDGKPIETYEPGGQGEGFRSEFDAFMQDVLAGRTENALVTHQHTLDIMETLDTIRGQIGLTFAQDQNR